MRQSIGYEHEVHLPRRSCRYFVCIVLGVHYPINLKVVGGLGGKRAWQDKAVLGIRNNLMKQEMVLYG